MVKTLPSNEGSTVSIPGRGTRIPQASWPKKPKHKNRSNIVTNSIKTKNIPHQKNIKKKNNKTKQLCASNAGGTSSIPVPEMTILCVAWQRPNKQKTGSIAAEERRSAILNLVSST